MSNKWKTKLNVKDSRKERKEKELVVKESLSTEQNEKELTDIDSYKIEESISMKELLEQLKKDDAKQLAEKINPTATTERVIKAACSSEEGVHNYEMELNKKVDRFKHKYNKIRYSYIDNDDEEEEAKKLIEDLLGFEPPRAVGRKMLVKLNVTPDDIVIGKDSQGKEIALVMPKEVSVNAKYRTAAALVISKGPDCYTGPVYEEHWIRSFLRKFFNRWMKPCTKQHWCRVGDWVALNSGVGNHYVYKGIPMKEIYHDEIGFPIQDPLDVTRD